MAKPVFNPGHPASVAALFAFIVILGGIAVKVFNRGEDDSSLGASKIPWKR